MSFILKNIIPSSAFLQIKAYIDNAVSLVVSTKNDFGGNGNGITDNVPAFEAANELGYGVTMYSGTYLINSNLEITIPLTLLSGAQFLIPSGVTLTISNGFECGLHCCFTGDGNVVFNGGSVNEAPIQWFGAVSNNNVTTFENDISTSLNKALSCNATILIPSGYYYLASTVEITSPCNINLNTGIYPYDRYPPPVNNTIDPQRNNRSVIYTNLDIDFFVIKSRSVWITGGSFDATNVIINTGTKAVFHYIPQGLSNVESYGMRQGGVTDFLIVGNGTVLKNANNGIIGIYLDWANAEANSYMYQHTWKGYFENVKFCLYETTDEGSGASNSAWHNMIFNVWIAKQAIVLNRSTENNIDITFQSAPVLATSEKDMAAMYFKGTYGNQITSKFVDMFGIQSTDPESIYYLGWYHKYSIEDFTGKNFYTRTNTDVDLTERSRKRVAGAVSGISKVYADSMSGVFPSGQYSDIYEGFRSALYSNTLTAADKRYHLTVGYYEKPLGVPFTDITIPSFDYGCATTTNVVGQRVSNLWYPYVGFTEFFWLEDAIDTDYVEFYIDGIDNDFIRFNEFYLTGTSSSASLSGIKQIQVVTRDFNGVLLDNILIETEPSFTRTSRYSIALNDQIQVKSIIIRLIGLHIMDGQQSFGVQDFAIFKPYNGNPDNITDNNTAPLLSIAGHQRVWGEIKVAGTQNSPADLIVGDSAWNGTGLFRMGNYRFWVDNTGALRIKNGVPLSDTDGNLV